ncbi:fibrohexamerin-like [Pararge aegeria]|uniref:Fibrohexamerin n=1 Tax=Pararge aegeria aegeria TaxID=348720 RepID=A0A8S4R1E2_9NEOP|nr:fibrohexamerin-like [Pararge aegeria]CAH2229513.1 jg17629 [Pararge aegeria aegeria]
MLLKTIILIFGLTACAAVPSSIVRPCDSIPCIARHLASQSACNPNVRGSVPSEYTIRNFRFDTPYFNATYIDNDLVIRNHDKCFVSEFYYNVATQKAVLSLDCPLLEFQSTRTVVQHYSLREDLTYNYSYHGTYPMVRLTSTMPLTQPFDMCRAFTFADVTALPRYHINVNNKRTANFLSRDETFLNIFERETFFWRGRQLARFFINSLICDFGCDF